MRNKHQKEGSALFIFSTITTLRAWPFGPQKSDKSSWSIALDIQNLINRRNVDAINRTYDPDLNQWIFRQQSGLTPLIMFQIDF
ncbi:MAG: hypothetical protein IPL65_14415 [Lewinellaceae bacterium]|nr:hypothetical protein [Lewinellaceae bacterium]